MKPVRAFRCIALPSAVTPYEVFRGAPASAFAAVLENPGRPSERGRWSMAYAAPFLVLRAKDGLCHAGAPEGGERLEGRPFEVLARVLNTYRFPRPEQLPPDVPFSGGAAGYLGYELLHELEAVPAVPGDDLGLPDLYLVFYGLLVLTDLVEKKSFLLVNAFAATPAEAERRADALVELGLGQVRSARLVDAADAMARHTARLRASMQRLSEDDLVQRGTLTALERAAYLERIRRAQEHIAAGDIYEVCLTNRYELECAPAGQTLYEALRVASPAPFAAYLRFPEVEVLSSSPERYLKLDADGWVESRPIKGTRPRGRTEEEDLALRQALATDPKDRAENLMIVDLVRNDLGRVCEFGTVRVSQKCQVESYPFTHQLVSAVRGKLASKRHVVDLLRASFPGGSMTGAPKVEAMKIISQLEPVRRGIYSGCIGHFDFEGSADFSIVIRTFIKTGRRLTFHVGGAIVADSNPEAEYQEILDKAHGLIVASEVARALG